MRSRWLLLLAGLGLLTLGVVLGAVLFADDDSGSGIQPIPTSRAAPDVTTAAYADQPTLAGTLFDGRPWVLRLDPDYGICQIIGTVDFGCEVPNTILSDRATPRRVVESTPFSDPQSAILMYAYLPSDATQVELVRADGSSVAVDETVEPTTHMWATPVTPGDNPTAVIYRDGNGTEVARY